MEVPAETSLQVILACERVVKKLHQQAPLEVVNNIDPQLALNRIIDQAANHLKLSKPEKERLESEFKGLGPLIPLFKDNRVSEIIVNGPEEISYERDGLMHQLEDHFLSPFSYKNFIKRLSEKSNIQVDLQNPFGNGTWEGFRVHIVHESMTQNLPLLTIRKHPKKVWSFQALLENNWASAQQIDFLKSLIHSKKTILAVGPTGTGKTSLLNCFLQEIPSTERAVIIEDTPELVVPNPLSCRMITREDRGKKLNSFNQSDLVIQSLRMRPDRLVMGEIRGSEAKDFALALSTGHKGSFASIHAEDGRQALWRLEMLVQMGAPQWSLETIRSLIQLSIDYLVVLKKEGEARKLESIYKLASLERMGITLNKIGL